MTGHHIPAAVIRHAAAIVLGSLLLPLVAAEGALAVWAFGGGTLDGTATMATTVIHAGQVVEAGIQPVRLELIGFPGSDVILAGGSVARFSLESTVGQSAPSLVVQLELGALAVDVTGSGPYAAVIVRGAALESRATSADFIIERGADLDYVALAKGLLLVRLRAGLAAADGMTIQLQARQGLAGSAKGLSEVDQLNRRPQLDRTQTIQEHAAGTSAEGDWSRDEAALATQDPAEDGNLTCAPASPSESAASAIPVTHRRPLREPAPSPAIEPGSAPVEVPAPPAEPAPGPLAVEPAPAPACTAVAQRPAPILAADLRAAAGARGAAVFLR